MPGVLCIDCGRNITSKRRVLICCGCGGQQHLTCGDTGIYLQQYKVASRSGNGPIFTCGTCRDIPDPMDISAIDVTVNYSDSGPSDIQDTDLTDIYTSRSDEALDDTSNDDVFDVTRPFRQVQEELQESSMEVDETVHDVPEATRTKYKVINGGSVKGHGKLVSSDGYAYVFKRKLVNGTTDWRCSVRQKSSGG